MKTFEDLHAKEERKVSETRDKRSGHKRVQILKFIGFVVVGEICREEEKL
jgi:hypothetical protein